MVRDRRIFFAVVGKPFLAGLAVPALIGLIAVSFADTNVDWSLLKGQLAAGSKWQAAAAVTLLAAVWAWLAGRALARVWRQPMIRFLVRQPLSRWQWVGHLLPNVGVGLAPIAAVCWLIEPQTNGVVHYAAFAALAWPMLLGASYRGWPMLVTYLGGAALFAVSLFGYLHAGSWIYGALAALPIALPLAVAPIRRQVAVIGRRGSTDLTDFNPVRALIRRDWLGLVRLERKRLSGLAVWTLLAPAMVLAFRINGGVQGREALLTAVVFFSLVASTVYHPMERLKVRLGKEVTRLRWPITPEERATALILLFGLLLAPSAALIGLLGSSMGYLGGSAFLAFVCAAAVIAAWIFSRSLATSRATIGLYLLTIAAHGGALFLLPEWAYVLLAGALIALGFRATAERLRHFAVAAEVHVAGVA